MIYRNKINVIDFVENILYFLFIVVKKIVSKTERNNMRKIRS